MITKQLDHIDAKMNAPVKIILQSKSTAGYDWSPKFNASVVKLIKKHKIVTSKAIGASPKTEFNFKPLSKGDHEIVFFLQRPWENKPIEKKQFILHVV